MNDKIRITDETRLRAWRIGDVRYLTTTERDVLARIDLFGSEKVGGIVLDLELKGIKERATKKAIRAMLAEGRLEITR